MAGLRLSIFVRGSRLRTAFSMRFAALPRFFPAIAAHTFVAHRPAMTPLDARRRTRFARI